MRPCHSILFTALRKKCPYSEFFWSECRKILTSTDIFQAALLTQEKFRSLFQRPYIPNFEYAFAGRELTILPQYTHDLNERST